MFHLCASPASQTGGNYQNSEMSAKFKCVKEFWRNKLPQKVECRSLRLAQLEDNQMHTFLMSYSIYSKKNIITLKKVKF